jgi:hypothetical protein
VDSNNPIGPITEVELQLRIGLEDYPAVGSSLVPFTIRWRECEPLNFRAPRVPSYTYHIGDRPTTITYTEF